MSQYPKFEARRREIRRQNIIWNVVFGLFLAVAASFFTIWFIDAATRGTALHPDCPTAAC